MKKITAKQKEEIDFQKGFNAGYSHAKEEQKLEPLGLLDIDNDISIIGKCANCGVEFHIHNPSKTKN